tara:strand:+ start:10706 stop:10957 length:252 start_codon:yes stop_codon:yes gene_type:complete
MEVRNRFRLFNSKGIHYNDSVKSHCQVLFSLTIKRGTMEQAEFDKLMETYQETHGSSILSFARDLYMVVTFIGVAYLILTTMI